MCSAIWGCMCAMILCSYKFICNGIPDSCSGRNANDNGPKRTHYVPDNVIINILFILAFNNSLQINHISSNFCNLLPQKV